MAAPHPPTPVSAVQGKPPNPCQAWVPVLISPSGLVLVSRCHGYQSQLLWQKRTPPQGRALLLLTSLHPAQGKCPVLPPWAGSKERKWVSGMEPVGKDSESLHSHSPTITITEAPLQEHNAAATYTLHPASTLQMEEWGPPGAEVALALGRRAGRQGA